MANIFSLSNLGLGTETTKSETTRQSVDFLSVANFRKKYGPLVRNQFGRPNSGTGQRAKRRAYVSYKGLVMQVFVEDGVSLDDIDSMWVDVQQSSNRGLTGNLVNFTVDEEDAE